MRQESCWGGLPEGYYLTSREPRRRATQPLQLGTYGVADGPDLTTSLGAAVLEAYGDQLAATDREAADAAYRNAAGEQRSFAAAATSGGEGLARMP